MSDSEDGYMPSDVEDISMAESDDDDVFMTDNDNDMFAPVSPNNDDCISDNDEVVIYYGNVNDLFKNEDEPTLIPSDDEFAIVPTDDDEASLAHYEGSDDSDDNSHSDDDEDTTSDDDNQDEPILVNDQEVFVALNSHPAFHDQFRARIQTLVKEDKLITPLAKTFLEDCTLGMLESRCPTRVCKAIPEAIMSVTPPTIDFFLDMPSVDKLNPQILKDNYIVYALVMAKESEENDNIIFRISIGSAANSKTAAVTRMRDHRNEYSVPKYVKTSKDEGFEIVHIGVLAAVPVPSMTTHPMTRQWILILEALFTVVFWTFWRSKRSDPDAHYLRRLCHWNLHSLQWRGLNSHSPLSEGVQGLMLTEAQLLKAAQAARESFKASTKKYRKSEKHRETARRWRKTVRGKENEQRWNRSEKGKASKLRCSRSDHGRAYNKAYRETEKAKTRMRERNASDHGKAVRKIYYNSDHGKAVAKAWRESEKGQASRKASQEKTKAKKAADPNAKIKALNKSRKYESSEHGKAARKARRQNPKYKADQKRRCEKRKAKKLIEQMAKLPTSSSSQTTLKSTMLKSTMLKPATLRPTTLKQTALKPTALKPTTLKQTALKPTTLKQATLSWSRSF